MSQVRIKYRPMQSQDWMQELEADAANFQALVSRIDELAGRALGDLTIRHDYVTAAIRVSEIQEGLQLLCKLAGIKVTPYVTNT